MCDCSLTITQKKKNTKKPKPKFEFGVLTYAIDQLAAYRRKGNGEEQLQKELLSLQREKDNLSRENAVNIHGQDV